jgi:hypothetical protein
MTLVKDWWDRVGGMGLMGWDGWDGDGKVGFGPP